MSLCSVLIVDDNSAIRAALRGFLESRTRLKVCGEAGDGAEAIEKAKQLRPDVILMDLAMPEMNGAEAASVIRHEMPDTRIVVFTMYAERLVRPLAKFGVDVVVAKDEGASGLMKALQPLLLA